MTSHRLASLLVLGVGAATVAFNPRTVRAQIMTVAATELSSRAWLGNACSDVACLRNMIAQNFSLTFVPVGASAELFRRAKAFVPSTDLSAFASDCQACKVDSRPFMIPPGLLFQLMSGQGGAGKSHADADHDDDSKGSPGAGPVSAGGASAATLGAAQARSFANAAAVTEVTSNPEPSTIALMATGLVGLVPVLRRKRRE